MLQHYLPKKYALLEFKPGKRNQSGSNLKYTPEDVLISLFRLKMSLNYLAIMKIQKRLKADRKDKNPTKRLTDFYKIKSLKNQIKGPAVKD